MSFGSRFCKEHDGIATLHAELGAILGLERSVTEGATLYVARVGKDGGFSPLKALLYVHGCDEACRHQARLDY